MRTCSDRSQSWRARRLLGLTVAVALIAAACGTDAGDGGDWAAINMDHRNSRFQSESSITGRNIRRLKQAWFIQTEDTTSTPVVVDDRVYFADWGGTVHAVRVKDGAPVWRTKFENPISNSVAVADGRVYVALSPYDTEQYPPTTGNRLAALSQKTGELLWQTRLESSAHGIWSSPVYYGGMVYVGAASAVGQAENDPAIGGAMFGVDAKTGQVVWERQLEVERGGAGVFGSVAIDEEHDAIVFGTANTYETEAPPGYAYSILSLDARTGTTRWKFRVNEPNAGAADWDFGSSPNLFRLRTGEREDELAVGLGAKDGAYYIVAADDGALLRKIQVSSTGGILGISGYVPSERGRAKTVFVPTYRFDYDLANPDVCCGGVTAIDIETTAIKWTAQARSQVIGSVAVVRGAVVFGDSKGNLTAVAVTDGRELLRIELEASIQSGVTVAADRVFVPTARGNPGFPPQTHPIPKRAVGLYAFALPRSLDDS
jgi:outer membrane protein assembly factor BamB